MLPGIDAPFQGLAKATGASVDQLKLLALSLFSYPLAGVLKRIPDANLRQKNAFIIAVSLFYLVGLFDLWDGLRTVLWSSIGTYVITYYIDGSLMPWIAFVFLMGHMSINHIVRQILNDPDTIDITGVQMVLVMKLSAFAWNVHDGRIKPELLSETQKEKAIYTMPGYLNYAGYVLFFPSLFTGPAFDYVDYRRWIETTMFDVQPNEKAPPTRKQRRIPRSGTPATLKAVEGLFWILMFMILRGWYSFDLLLSDDVWTYSLLRRIWYMYALGFTNRTKYYGVWSLSEGACILSGLGYNGIDPQTKRPRWDRLNNVYPWGIEAAQNAHGYLDSWNRNTNNWLRHYVYLRVTPKGKKPGFRATLATFTTSAFWHGFEPGYYMTFVLGAFVQTVAKNFRRYVRPFFLTPDGKAGTEYKIYYDVIGWFVTQTAFCFVTAPFVVLSFGDSIKAWASVWFYCIIGVAISTGFFASPATPWLKKRLEKRNHPHVLKRVGSDAHMPTLGIPDTTDIDRAIDEIKEEVELRRRRGSKVEFPSGEALQKAVQERMWLRRKDVHVDGGQGKPKIDSDALQEAIKETLNSSKKEK